jgi:mxaL protein
MGFDEGQHAAWIAMKTRVLRVLAIAHLLTRSGAGCYLLALLMLAPVWFEPTMTLPGKVQDTLFVIDISESMNVPDAGYPAPRTSRLELAKETVRAAMSAMNCGSRVSLGLFAGEQTVVLFEPLEICHHFPAIEQVLSRLTTHMRWIGDSIIEQGVIRAIEEAQARKLNVIFISDGDAMPHKNVPRVTALEAMRGKIRGGLLTVGGDAPLPVPRVDASGQVLDYWTAEEAVKEGYHPNLLALVDGLEPGQKAPEGLLDEVGEHLSAARPAYMEAIANAAGLEFKRLQYPQDGALLVSSAALTREAAAARDARWIFGLSACLLVMIGWFWPSIKQFDNTRRLNPDPAGNIS